MYYIYLDDIRDPNTKLLVEWHIDRTAEEFKKRLEHWAKFRRSEVLSLHFDHDLGDADAETGYDAIKWFVDFLTDTQVSEEFILNRIDICVHSANPVGRDNILGYWNGYCKCLSQGIL